MNVGRHERGVQDVVIFGASGYSGLELIRILARHPKVRIQAASSDRFAGEPIARQVPAFRSDLAFKPHDAVLKDAQAGQVALLATPATTSADLAPKLLDRGLKVVDVSGAFRLPAEQYPEWYGFEHPCPELLNEAYYGLAELFEMPEKTHLVANPGCYATASILAVAPLVAAGLADPSRPIIVDGKSGTTGAGRKAKENLIFSQVAENLRPYRLGKHQHTPEIERALGHVADKEVLVSFTAHLVPMRRGILCSAYVSLTNEATPEAVTEAYRAQYDSHPFLRFLGETPPETATVQTENFVDIGVTVDPRTRTALAFSAIDNLVKGAAGQAIQNLNRLMGLPHETGLLPSEG